jgi:aspartyl-tRNA(Asn)/glutamyl-tRNA(Gln) amidotransferase subunit A
VHEHWLKQRPQDYGARGLERLLAGATLTAAQYLQATHWRAALKRQTLAAFRDLDAAITASSMDPACRIDDAEALARNYWRQARMPFNVTGQPALAIPAGFARSGLPLSLQIIGQPFDEAMCYRVGHAYEQASGWVRRHPTF